MKNIFFGCVALFFYINVMLWNISIDAQDMAIDRYKRALESGCEAAAQTYSYGVQADIFTLSNGFGVGTFDSNNIPIDRNLAIQWFYKLFFENLNMYTDAGSQSELKKKIPIKALASYASLSIADNTDTWIVDAIPYRIYYNGVLYDFTLSQNMKRVSDNVWFTDVSLGIDPKIRKALVNSFIRSKINTALVTRSDRSSNRTYEIALEPENLTGFEGFIDSPNFIVIAEGFPLPAPTADHPDGKYYATAIGGTEVKRK